MNRGLVFTLIIFLLLITLGVLLAFDVGRGGNQIAVKDFDECQRLGYPIMESYPRQCRTPDGQSFTEVLPTATSTPTVPATTTPATPPIQASSTESQIRGISLKAGQTIASPLTITGQARGPWYFEATFPIRLVDGNGKMVVETYAEAKAEWMTENFVPFTSKVIFNKPFTATGTIIIMNANPSGEPERDMEVHIPIIFE